MKLALILFGVLSALEWSVFVAPVWRFRRLVLGLVIAGLSVVSGMFVVAQPNVLGVLLFAACLYRIFNDCRIVAGRMHERFARQAGWRTSWTLTLAQVLLLGVIYILDRVQTQGATLWQLAAGLQLLLAVVLAYGLYVQRQRLTPPPVTEFTPHKSLPTLSVCIPARNEDASLQACLQSLVASDYPKLEILVLDDCSQNRRTTDIIKDFAHEGVVFVKGEEPQSGWLAKNQAYQKLFDASSGDVVLFCGVDLRVKPDSLRLAVDLMLQQQWSMLTVLPKNILPPGLHDVVALVVQPFRYAYELLIPRRVLQRPPVLSTCWLAKRELVVAAGAFESVSRSIIPERYFARAAEQAGSYAFIASDDTLGITDEKPAQEQLQTAIRLRYPQIHRRPEVVGALSAVGVLLAVVPLVLLVYAQHSGDVLLGLLALLSIIMETGVYIWLIQLTYRRFLWRSLLSLPVALVADMAILNFSMYKYEFSEVEWKGRNVCLPPLEVIAHLPELQ